MSRNPGPDVPPPPLCVTLNGALLRTDSLPEQLLRLARRAPLRLLTTLSTLRTGRAAFKRAVAEAAALDPATLPLNEPFLQYLQGERARGRELALVSAADDALVQTVARELGLFAWARGSNGRTNLSGRRKLAAIRERYAGAFAYAGSRYRDADVWQAAKARVLFGRDPWLGGPGAGAAVEAAFPGPPRQLALWFRALRLHQWAKNLLLLVPVLLAGPSLGPAIWLAAALGVLVFSLVASAGYVVNDLLDLDADRQHPTKRLRPFAAGELSAGQGLRAVLVLVTLAITLSLLEPAAFALVAGLYLAGTLAYSLWLKRVPLLDVLVLAGLFTARIYAGALLLPLPVSFWLMTFSMFFFLSLALVKRHAELSRLGERAKAMLTSRGYSETDLPLLLPAGLASGIAANVIFVIYLIDEKFPVGIYRRPQWLWLVFPILTFWLLRTWRLALHGRMDDDPVLFALKDRLSLALGALIGVLLALAW